MKVKIKNWLVLPLIITWLMLSMSGCSDDEESNVIKDRDGNVYSSVTIGTRVWLTENLKTTKFNDGSPITMVTGTDQWAALSTPAYTWFDNNSANKAVFGGLYNGYVVTDTRGVCPTGWHVSTEADWIDMETALGMSLDQANATGDRGMDQNVGGKMKAAVHWDDPNTGANNSSGFTALGHGCRRYEGGFAYYHTEAGFYTSTKFNNDEMWIRYLGNWHSGVYRDTRNLNYGYAIRCVKD